MNWIKNDDDDFYLEYYHLLIEFENAILVSLSRVRMYLHTFKIVSVSTPWAIKKVPLLFLR